MIIKQIEIFIINFLIFKIKIYKFCFSPILKINCRHMPTCSEYAITALKEHGFIIGIILSFKRVFSCHPFGSEGYDPVPKKLKGNIK